MDEPGGTRGQSALFALGAGALVLVLVTALLVRGHGRGTNQQAASPAREYVHSTSKRSPTSPHVHRSRLIKPRHHESGQKVPPLTHAQTSLLMSRLTKILAQQCSDERVRLPIRVVSLNMHHGVYGGRSSLPTLLADLQTWEPDVVLLDEVDRFQGRSGGVDQAQWLGDQLDLHVAYGANLVHARGFGQAPAEYGVAVLSRFPITAYDNTRLPNWPGKEPRGLLSVRLDVHGTRVDVYATHLQFDSPGLRVEQMQAVLDHISTDTHPHLLGGDMNTAPETVPIQLASSQLTDSWTVKGVGPGYTSPVVHPRNRIDYLFHSDQFRVRSIVVANSHATDHLGLVADYTLPFGKAC